MSNEKIRTLNLSDFLDFSKDEENLNLQDICNPSSELMYEIHRKLEGFLCSKIDERYCEALLNLYQFGNSFWKSFVLQFLPSLISLYLNFTGRRQQSDAGRLEAIFLSIYNAECTRNLEAPFLRSFRIPSLSNASVYHQPSSTSSPMLTECILSRHEQSNKAIQLTEPRILCDRMSLHLRSVVLKTVLQVYNRKIASMSDISQLSFCKMGIRYAANNLMPLKKTDNILKAISQEELGAIMDNTRIKLSSDVIQEIITGLHYSMYNGCAETAIIGLESLAKVLNRSLNAPLNMKVTALLRSVHNSEKVNTALLRSPYLTTRRQTAYENRRYAFSHSVLKSSAAAEVANPVPQSPQLSENNSDNKNGKHKVDNKTERQVIGGQKLSPQKLGEKSEYQEVVNSSVKVNINESISIHGKMRVRSSAERLETAL